MTAIKPPTPPIENGGRGNRSVEELRKALRWTRGRYRNHLADRVDVALGWTDPPDFRDLFARVWPHLRWDHRPSARRLYLLAKSGPGVGQIVEIGSYLGNSTIFLAGGTAIAGRELVHAIDPHTSESMIQTPSPSDASEQFLENLKTFNVRSRVVYHRTTSLDLAGRWSDGPVRLLYIDGLHTYSAVVGDFSAWHPHLAKTYVTVFDDFLWPEVEHAVRRLRETYQPRWFAVRGGQAIFSSQPLHVTVAGLI